MMRLIGILIFFTFALTPLYGQDSTSTEFQQTESTTYEDALTIGESAFLVPLAIGSTAIGILPPSGGLHIRDGVANGMVSFESGIGFGKRKSLKLFSDARLKLGFTHIFSSRYKDFVRIEATKDFHLGFIDRREVVLFGVSPSVGVFTEFPSTGFSIGVSAWLMTPWLSYIGFIPQHTFGLAYRFNRYLGGNVSGEISAGMSSAFTWGW